MQALLRLLPKAWKVLKQARKIRLPKKPLKFPPSLLKFPSKIIQTFKNQRGTVYIMDKEGKVIKSFVPKEYFNFTKIKNIKPPPAIKETVTKGLEKIGPGKITVTPPPVTKGPYTKVGFKLEKVDTFLPTTAPMFKPSLSYAKKLHNHFGGILGDSVRVNYVGLIRNGKVLVAFKEPVIVGTTPIQKFAIFSKNLTP